LIADPTGGRPANLQWGMAKAPPSRLLHTNVNGDEVYYSWRLDDSGGGFDLKTSPESTSAAIQVHVAWSALNVARRAFVGYPTIRYEGNIAYISRNLPLFLPAHIAADPDSPTSPFLACRAITRTEGVGPAVPDPATGFPRYKLARLTLQFAAPPYKIQPDSDPNVWGAVGGPLPGLPDESRTRANGEFVRFVRRTTDAVDRTITIPQVVMRWVLEPGDPNYTIGPGGEPGPPLMEAYGVQEPGVDVTVAHYEVPALNLSTILATMGATNLTAFAGFPARTLVCLAPRIRYYTGAAGLDLYDVQHRFRFLSKVESGTPPTIKTANHFLRAIKTAAKEYQLRYRELSSTGRPEDGDRLHRDMEFANLLRLE
jgi:hypothetical protein